MYVLGIMSCILASVTSAIVRYVNNVPAVVLTLPFTNKQDIIRKMQYIIRKAFYARPNLGNKTKWPQYASVQNSSS